MSDFISIWQSYSKKMIDRIEHPRNVGSFDKYESEEKGMTLVSGDARDELYHIKLHWLVDPSDGVIVDAKFQTSGSTFLIGALDTLCEIVLRKTYEQARKLKADIIVKDLTEHICPEMDLLFQAIDDIALACEKQALPKSIVTPISDTIENGVYPDWDNLSQKERLSLIEAALNEDVRPYIELDEGGIEILDLKDLELHIAYKGACTSCFSSIGTTLESIQSILQAKIHKELSVIPNMDHLKF